MKVGGAGAHGMVGGSSHPTQRMKVFGVGNMGGGLISSDPENEGTYQQGIVSTGRVIQRISILMK